MKDHTKRTLSFTPLIVGGLLLTGLPSPAWGDDRNLLREGVGDPYVFILFDTSSSMHLAPPCSQADFDAGNCNYLCPAGDCFVPRNGDDPASKFRQAKEALFQVMSSVDTFSFGFATYNQDALQMRGKHWLYRVRAGEELVGGIYPPAGAQEVFGRTWDCRAGSDVGCRWCANGPCTTIGLEPADTNDLWEMVRVHRLPKLGQDGTETTNIYVRDSGTTYRVELSKADALPLGDPFLHIRVRIKQCNNADCSIAVDAATAEIHYDLIGEFASSDQSEAAPFFFTADAADDQPASATCTGWEGNGDGAQDPYNGYNLKFPTDTSDPRGVDFYLGDRIPLDWNANQKERILRRLAPNRVLAEIPADFGVARYFQNEFLSGEDFLRLDDENVRPLVASGGTPIADAIRSFRIWYTGCPQGGCPKVAGWSDAAAGNDPDWGCRRVYLLQITDGDENCPGPDACSGTAALFAQEAVKTFVVAFGAENTAGNRLTCLAANGGSGTPYFPQNKQELITALTNIFSEIQEETRAFASAAVPSVQAEVEDKIFLSSFVPVNGAAVWPGDLDAYLKPLPLTVDGRPDRDRACDAQTTGACHLWNAAEAVVSQAPTQAELDADAYRLSKSGANDRRVFYAKDTAERTPRKKRLFKPSTDVNDKYDLWDGLGIPFIVGDVTSEAAAELRATEIIKQTLVKKTETVDAASGPVPVTYVLGDIFHSDPLVLENPNDFRFYASDVYSDDTACSAGNPGYRCFADKHRRRRKLLAVGANDAQVHFFDAGIWDATAEKFNNGTGKEVFSYIPHMLLPVVTEQAEGIRQIFGPDGSLNAFSVFMDPRHDGTPNAAEREWRTLVIGALREGGRKDGGGRAQPENGAPFTSGYYALDVTQPDKLTTANLPINGNVVPSCTATSDTPETGCGTVPFPSEVWEFTDSIDGVQLDEEDTNNDGTPDGNGFPDLGDTWSGAVVGRIQINLAGGGTEDKFVAIFGGGMDPENKSNPQRGSWLYMVDVETGEAIYKRPLIGPAPAAPAVVDIDRDGIIDRVYIGTTAGLLYKVDLGTAVSLQDVTARDVAGNPYTVSRITSAAWEPFEIFETCDSGQALPCRPIYFAATAVHVAALNRFALAFGSGDRENLWRFTGTANRFYMILDDDFQAGDVILPLDESDYKHVLLSDPEAAAGADFVVSPGAGLESGWILELETDERVITQAFSVSGVTIFGTYLPEVSVLAVDAAGREVDGVCARTGDSRVYVVFSNNANAILSSEQAVTESTTGNTLGEGLRYMEVGQALVTNPYVEQRATRNTQDAGEPDFEAFDEDQAKIIDSLRQLFPRNTKFSFQTLNVKFVKSDTGIVGPIPIPVGIIERNWKEF